MEFNDDVITILSLVGFMVGKEITPEDFLNKWSEDITNWGLRFYGEKGWKAEMSNDEITRGVIYPYLLTSLAPRLGVRVRFEIPLKWREEGKNKKMDAVLYDNEFITKLAHVEYENNYGRLLDENRKFHYSEPPLKVLITIPDLQNKADKAEFNEWVDISLSPIIFGSLQEKPDNKWLFLYSADLELVRWHAMKFENRNGVPEKIELA